MSGNDELGPMIEEIQAKNERIAEFEGYLADANKAITGQSETIRELRQRITKLEAERDALQERKEELEAGVGRDETVVELMDALRELVEMGELLGNINAGYGHSIHTTQRFEKALEESKKLLEGRDGG